MAEVSQFKFDHKEVVEALIKKQGLHEGIWQLSIEFGFGAAIIGAPTPGAPAPDQSSPVQSPTFLPAAIVPVNKIAIQKVEKESNLTVDAAKVNPLKGKGR